MRQLECLRAVRGRKEAGGEAAKSQSKPGRSTEPPRKGELGLKRKGRVTAPAAGRMKKMGEVNTAIEVGKHKLDVALGSDWSYPVSVDRFGLGC